MAAAVSWLKAAVAKRSATTTAAEDRLRHGRILEDMDALENDLEDELEDIDEPLELEADGRHRCAHALAFCVCCSVAALCSIALLLRSNTSRGTSLLVGSSMDREVVRAACKARGTSLFTPAFGKSLQYVAREIVAKASTGGAKAGLSFTLECINGEDRPATLCCETYTLSTQ